MYYYQVGGLGAHTNIWYPHFDTNGLSNFIFGALSAYDQASIDPDEKKKASIELVLGVLSNGTSYLLVCQAQMNYIRLFAPNARSPPPPRHASLYASLSPIAFHSPKELQAKLKTYVPKKGKARGKDSSQANKMYEQENIARAQFEHQRLLWHAIRNPIYSDEKLKKFGLCELPVWIASTSFVSLVPQTWQFDTFEKRKNEPTVLALELASVKCRELDQDNYSDKLEHPIQRVKVQEHAALSTGLMTYSREVSNTVVKKADLSKQLNEFFASIDSKQDFLLVYDAEVTLNALKKLGVDVSSYEQTGISTLLYGQREQQEDPLNYRANGHTDHQDDHRAYSSRYQNIANGLRSDPRMRSRSPRHQDNHRPRSYSPTPRESQATDIRNASGRDCAIPNDPDGYSDGEIHEEEDGEEEEEEEEETAPRANIYVIDVQALFLTLRRLDKRSLGGLHDLARRLDIPVDPNGNDCLLLIEAWRRMALGNAIDEQYAERWPAGGSAASATKVKPTPDCAGPGTVPNVASAETNDNEEMDPNDIVVNRSAQPPPVRIAGVLRPPDSDSDESDY